MTKIALPGQGIPALSSAVPAEIKRTVDAIRGALFNHEERLQEKERELRTLEQLLRGATAQDSLIEQQEAMPFVTNFQMRALPKHVMFLLSNVPFIVSQSSPIPQRAVVDLLRGLEADSSVNAKIADSTQKLVLEDAPPPDVRYRYWLRYRSADSTRIGPMSPPEGIEFAALRTDDPEFVVAPGEGGIFLETFAGRDVLDRWFNVSGTNPTVDYPENGIVGGIVARIAGAERWNVHRTLLPFDPTVLYRIRAGVKRTANSTSPVGADDIYVGVTGVAADGETLINEGGLNAYGSQHYVAAAAQIPALGTYTEYTGYFKGHGTTPFANATSVSNPTPLRTGVKYIRPTVIVNYNLGNGTTEVDYVRIDAVSPLDVALGGELTKPAVTLPADASGNVTSYTGANGTFVVRYGTQALNPAFVTFAIVANPQNLTASIDVDGNYSVTAGFDVGEPSASVTFRATFQGASIDRVFSLGKAVTGAGGASGSDGLDALTVSAVPEARTIACDQGGVPKAGELPVAVQLTVFSGSTDVTSAATYSHVVSNVAVTNNGGGSYSITQLNADSGYLEVTVTHNARSAKKRISLSKAAAGASASSAIDNTISVLDATGYTGTQGGPLTIPVGPGGTINCSITRSYTSTSTGTLAGKFQYRTTPGSGVFTDFGLEVADPQGAVSGEPSALVFSQQLAGPGSAANWEFIHVNRRSAGSQVAAGAGTPQFTVGWSNT